MTPGQRLRFLFMCVAGALTLTPLLVRGRSALVLCVLCIGDCMLIRAINAHFSGRPSGVPKDRRTHKRLSDANSEQIRTDTIRVMFASFCMVVVAFSRSRSDLLAGVRCSWSIPIRFTCVRSHLEQTFCSVVDVLFEPA